jgi:hypothetical protein
MFELWDAELGVSLGSYDTEAEALAAVRRLCLTSDGSRAPLGLIKDHQIIVATGDALVARAHASASPV